MEGPLPRLILPSLLHSCWWLPGFSLGASMSLLIHLTNTCQAALPCWGPCMALGIQKGTLPSRSSGVGWKQTPAWLTVTRMTSARSESHSGPWRMLRTSPLPGQELGRAEGVSKKKKPSEGIFAWPEKGWPRGHHGGSKEGEAPNTGFPAPC